MTERSAARIIMSVFLAMSVVPPVLYKIYSMPPLKEYNLPVLDFSSYFCGGLIFSFCEQAEEKLRLLHVRKLRKLKRMDERGTDAPKVDSTRRFVRSLSTKIRIAIQVVDKISVTINKIRDEELWLQLNQLIQG